MEKKVVKIIDEITDVILIIFFALCLLIGVYIAYDSYYVYSGGASAKVLGFKPELLPDGNIDTGKLSQLSGDVIGWITIDDTNIDYPIMQGVNNEEYLNKNPYGEFALAGSIFMDSSNTDDFSDQYNLIYGHHMDYGQMFGSLDDFRNPDFCSSHQTGRIITLSGEVINVRLLAVSETLTTNGTVFDVSYGNNNLTNLYEFITGNNLYLNDIAMGEARIFALSTCASTTSQERLVVFFIEEI